MSQVLVPVLVPVVMVRLEVPLVEPVSKYTEEKREKKNDRLAQATKWAKELHPDRTFDNFRSYKTFLN